MKIALALSHIVGLIVALYATFGCGGASKVERPTTGWDRAIVELRVHWPLGRAIPPGTNRLIVFVNADDIPGGIAYIVDREANELTKEVRIEIPAGNKRRISVVAVRVSTTGGCGDSGAEPCNGFRVSTTSPMVREGERLGAGAYAMTPDVAPGSSVRADITVNGAGDGAGVTSVAIVINQIQVTNGRWPGVIALQMIRDQNGDPVSGLNVSNFEVLEDGVPCVVMDVRTGRAARNELDISMVLDRSGSMSGEPNEKLEEAARTFVGLMQDSDRGEVINFGSDIVVAQPFTVDKDALIGAIVGRIADQPETRFYGALEVAANRIASQPGRRAVIAMTDGMNNAAPFDPFVAITAARRASTPVFTVGMGNVDAVILNQIATETGGLFYIAPSASELNAIYLEISRQLESQVQIDFVSPDPVPSSRVRRVSVRFRYGAVIGQSEYEYVF